MYWLFFAYLAIGYFYPAAGIVALICMLAPVLIAPFKGRYWCGNYCPRGSLYDNLLSRFSPRKPIPAFFRTLGFRTFMVAFIMTVFSVQMYYAWGNWDEMGLVFLRIIFITTVVGIVLGLIYNHRTWCSFCPMGTMASWLTRKTAKPLNVEPTCVSCKLCTKACPFDLTPYDAKGTSTGYTHNDCLKCEKCVAACPKQSLTFKS
ncbi:4Fe-4S binding protein [Sporomusa malonica]|uniref:4Fe-4S binding domain-containing protein n=1 Tax=Sporomusa malonica TaxID=112901 RepID=A0A1W2CBM5_9FIRM|nr:4Fe-4S binding protein [Sporomusa malonica]SMC82593.1 4Fe-4S binding domain-containing protein [Sporomusa malonica]